MTDEEASNDIRTVEDGLDSFAEDSLRQVYQQQQQQAVDTSGTTMVDSPETPSSAKSLEFTVLANLTATSEETGQHDVAQAMMRGKTLAYSEETSVMGKTDLHSIETPQYYPNKVLLYQGREPETSLPPSKYFFAIVLCLVVLLVGAMAVAVACGTGRCAATTVADYDRGAVVPFPPTFTTGPTVSPTSSAAYSSTETPTIAPSKALSKSKSPTKSPISSITTGPSQTPSEESPATTNAPTASPSVDPTLAPTQSRVSPSPTAPPILILTQAPTSLPTTTPAQPVFTLNNSNELRQSVDQYLMGSATFPPIGEWNVAAVTDFSDLFSVDRNPLAVSFDENLSGWNTSRARTLRRMFWGARNFRGDVSLFDTSQVTDMSDLFGRAERFNGAIGNWDMSSVQRLDGMFRGASSFNGDISKWSTGRVTTMSNLFLNAAAFNQNLALWDVSAVTDTENCFRSAVTFNQSLDGWQTQRVRDMSRMFMSATTFDGSVAFATNSVTTLTGTFMNAASFTGEGLESWDTSSVTSMDHMFYGAVSFQPDGIDQWTVLGVQDMSFMFTGATGFAANLCDWRTQLLAPWSPVDDLSATDMFVGTQCPDRRDPRTESLVQAGFCLSCPGSSPAPAPPSQIPLSTGSRGRPFATRGELLSAVDSYLQNGSSSSSVAQEYGYPMGNWDVGRISDFSELFSVNRNPDVVHLDEDLGNWDLSIATDLTSMFEGAVSFRGSGLSTWDVSQVRTLHRTFASTALEADLSAWNVGNCRDFSFAFEFAAHFEADLSLWSVQQAVNMGWMFRGATFFSSDVSTWDVAGVHDFKSMFAGATSFQSNLCRWEQIAKSDAVTRSMFAGSGCLYDEDPWLPSDSGSWCGSSPSC